MTIQNEQEYDQAVERVELLFSSECSESDPEELDRLLNEIAAYDDIHYPIADLDPNWNPDPLINQDQSIA